tara:strand:- start:314 stop:805 length:492 start_codon:yes stop_codon:yes gene_type:complete
MANVTKSTLKGYFQEGNIPSQANFEDLIDSTAGYVNSVPTTQVGTDAHVSEMNLIQPAGTVLTDIGVVATEATVGTSNTIVTFGTSVNQSQLATADFVSAGVAAVGSSVSMGGAKGESGVAWTATNAAALYTAASRTIYIKALQSATQTAGTFISYIKFIKLT